MTRLIRNTTTTLELVSLLRGDNMSVFFTRRGKALKLVSVVDVSITGMSLSTSICYASINGTKYSSPASGIEVQTGDVIEFNLCGYIYENLVQIAYIDPKASYNWTVPDGITSMTIEIGSGSVTYIYITTS